MRLTTVLRESGREGRAGVAAEVVVADDAPGFAAVGVVVASVDVAIIIMKISIPFSKTQVKQPSN